MIVLDTNVISESFRPHPDANLVEWLSKQLIEHIFTTAITKAELLSGLALMEDGKRKRALAEIIEVFLTERLANPVLPFSSEDAIQYGRIHAHRQRAGRPISELDCQIAAIALSHGFAVATRNVRDFENCGIQLINPWDVVT